MKKLNLFFLFLAMHHSFDTYAMFEKIDQAVDLFEQQHPFACGLGTGAIFSGGFCGYFWSFNGLLNGRKNTLTRHLADANKEFPRVEKVVLRKILEELPIRIGEQDKNGVVLRKTQSNCNKMIRAFLVDKYNEWKRNDKSAHIKFVSYLKSSADSLGNLYYQPAQGTNNELYNKQSAQQGYELFCTCFNQLNIIKSKNEILQDTSQALKKHLDKRTTLDFFYRIFFFDSWAYSNDIVQNEIEKNISENLKKDSYSVAEANEIQRNFLNQKIQEIQEKKCSRSSFIYSVLYFSCALGLGMKIGTLL